MRYTAQGMSLAWLYLLENTVILIPPARRVKDWLHGIIHTKPEGDSKTVVQSDTPSEALRSAYHLVTWTHEQGGAGITPGHGDWKRVTSSYPAIFEHISVNVRHKRLEAESDK